MRIFLWLKYWVMRKCVPLQIRFHRPCKVCYGTQLLEIDPRGGDETLKYVFSEDVYLDFHLKLYDNSFILIINDKAKCREEEAMN